MSKVRVIQITSRSEEDSDTRINEGMIAGLSDLSIDELKIEFNAFYNIPEYPGHATMDNKECFFDTIKERIKALAGEMYFPYSKTRSGYETEYMPDFISYCFYQWLQRYKGFQEIYIEQVDVDFIDILSRNR